MKFQDYLASVPADRREKILRKSGGLLQEMNLATLRDAAEVTQKEIGRRLNISQAAVSKLEGRADLLLSTFRRYVEAAGGTLSLVVNLPGMEFQFGNISEALATAGQRGKVPQRIISCISNGATTHYVVGEASTQPTRITMKQSSSILYEVVGEENVNWIENEEANTAFAATA